MSDDDYESEDVRSEDESDPGSLVEFITDDEEEEEDVTVSEDDEKEVNEGNIISGRRTRRAPVRYVPKAYDELMLEDVSVEEVYSSSEEAEELDSDDAEFVVSDDDEEESESGDY